MQKMIAEQTKNKKSPGATRHNTCVCVVVVVVDVMNLSHVCMCPTRAGGFVYSLGLAEASQSA